MGDMSIYIYLYATNQQNNTYARWKEEKDNDVFEKKKLLMMFLKKKFIYDVFQEK